MMRMQFNTAYLKEKAPILLTAALLLLIALFTIPFSGRNGGDGNDDGVLGGDAGRVAFRVGADAILVQNQPTGDELTVELADLANPGFVAVHRMDDERLGEHIGTSVLLERGGHERIIVQLNAPAEPGEELMAVLYVDNGDNGFHRTRDKVLYANGMPVGMRFVVR